MNVVVYGGGAVGLGIASCLLQSQVHVDIVASPITVEALRNRGLERSGIFGSVRFTPEQFTCQAKLKRGNFDCILVCTKSYDIESAASEIAQFVSTSNLKPPVILFQNGWGNAETFSRYYPEVKIFNARVITGFRRTQKHQVDITVHADSINIGSLFVEDIQPLDFLAQAIDSGGIPCRLTNEIEKDLIAKLLYNCALNPLGAIFNVPYGILGEWSHTREIMFRLVEEVFRVMQGRETHWSSAEEYMKTFYEKLLPPTYKHESSMLQDIRLAKVTEIDVLAGAVVSLGKNLKLETPYNHMIYKMVKFLEERQVRT